MVIGVHHGGADRAQELDERLPVWDVGSQGKCGHAVANEVVQVVGRLASSRDSYDDIVLAGQAMKQHCEGCQHRREETRPMRGSQTLDVADKLRGQGSVDSARREGPHRGTRPVARKVKARNTPGELANPVLLGLRVLG